MSNKQMTSVGYIIHELQCKFPKYMGDMYQSNQLLLEDIVLKAKELEKQQIIDAYEIGFADAWDDSRYDDEPT